MLFLPIVIIFYLFYGYDSHNISIYWIERTCKAFKITKVMIFYPFIYKNNKITAHSYITYCFYYHTKGDDRCIDAFVVFYA